MAVTTIGIYTCPFADFVLLRGYMVIDRGGGFGELYARRCDTKDMGGTMRSEVHEYRDVATLAL